MMCKGLKLSFSITINILFIVIKYYIYIYGFIKEKMYKYSISPQGIDIINHNTKFDIDKHK